ncbi:MAG TPA: hypothetical protein PKK06_07015 [Phycisphaerae bacterium]|nr:hypothetical protein [Phycisphaerae bacterium]HNU45110.1 hypothetical protein [Phycisphaerae bacterium]
MDQPERNVGQFPTTHWSLLARAAGEDADARRPALAEVLTRYQPAMRTHVARRFGRTLAADQIDDVVQGFITHHILEKELLGRADRARGRFRSLLCTALDRYVITELRRRRQGVASLEDVPPAPGKSAGPEQEFNLAWARQVIDEALSRMHARCAASRPELWELFETRLVGPILGSAPAPPYAQLVAQYGFASPMQAMNALVTAKRWFREALASVVAEYAGEDAEAEAEVSDLLNCLAGWRA